MGGTATCSPTTTAASTAHDAAGRKTLLLDRRGPHQYTADFEYIPEEGLLIVPSLYDNRLTAYRLATP